MKKNNSHLKTLYNGQEKIQKQNNLVPYSLSFDLNKTFLTETEASKKNYLNMLNLYVNLLINMQIELERLKVVQSLEVLKLVEPNYYYKHMKIESLSLEESIEPKKSLVSKDQQTSLTRRFSLNPMRFGTGGVGIYYRDGDGVWLS